MATAYSLQIMIPRWKVRSRHKMRKMPLTSRCRKHPKTIDTIWHDKKYRWIARCEGTARTALWNADRSLTQVLDRSWHVRLSNPQCSVCQVHKVLEQRFNLDGSPMARSRDQSETCCLEASRDIFANLLHSLPTLALTVAQDFHAISYNDTQNLTFNLLSVSAACLCWYSD